LLLEELFQRLWDDYASITPQAGRVHRLLEERGERIVNDHIAFRTYGVPEVEIEVLDRAFVGAGYQPAEAYDFPEKKLFAYHYEHSAPGLPKIFVSALDVGALSREAQEIIAGLIKQIPVGYTSRALFATSGRPWKVSYTDYQRLANESEYAAWVAAFGFRANHFTVDVGSLQTFRDLPQLNRFLAEKGFALNQSGGEIKGSPEVFLEQSSTMADEVEVEFSDGRFLVPSCYYEFARRYCMPNGQIFQGFVARSADRLFESTHHSAPRA
jgi:hypothetical protein